MALVNSAELRVNKIQGTARQVSEGEGRGGERANRRCVDSFPPGESIVSANQSDLSHIAAWGKPTRGATSHHLSDVCPLPSHHG